MSKRRNKQGLGAIAGVAVAVAVAAAGPAFAGVPPPVAHAPIVKTVVPARTIPLRAMQWRLPTIMQRIVGTHHFTRRQLAELREQLIRSGYLKGPGEKITIPLKRRRPALGEAPRVHDPVLQSQPVANRPDTVTVGVNFQGMGIPNDAIGCAPPDTDMAAGQNYVVELVNCAGGVQESTFAVFDKSGSRILGPVALSSLWSGGVCASDGGGDGVVLYDPLAGRWLIGQFAGPSWPTDECVAVSQTEDPTGAYYVYDFPLSSNFADYPKLAVWPDAYYLSFNEFNPAGTAFLGAGFVALQRSAMMQGQAAQMVEFVGNGNDLAASVLPADLDGTTLPPAGAPGLFLDYVSPYLWGISSYALELWQLAVDWDNPANSTLSGPTAFSVAPFNDGLCGLSRPCIPQPSPGEGLDSLGDRLMFRLAYRNFGDHQALVVNHTVGTGETPSSPPAGIRWYELAAPAGATDASDWTVAQQGTYLPADGASRWMGSIAMDHLGDLALGFSEASASLDSSVAVTGQNVGGPAGVMDAGETRLVSGSGVQENTLNRWGDYSAMAVDPSDDCTFWYAQEYYSATGAFNWSTHIGSFKFSNCASGPTGLLEGTISDAGSGNPLAGATVTLAPGGAQGSADQAGHYTLTAAPGDYTATATDFGYGPASSAVTITDDGDTTQDFALAQAPTATLGGRVFDAARRFPLYAEVKVRANGTTVADVSTGPLNGNYRITLPTGTSYDVSATAHLSGFETGSATFTLGGDKTQDFPLAPDGSCTAPGYGYPFQENFDEGSFPPPGWLVTNDHAGSDVVWRTSSGWYDSNYTNGAGEAPTADSLNADLFEGYSGPFDTSLVTPPIPVATVAADPTVSWTQSVIFNLGEIFNFDISTDGGNTWTNIDAFFTNDCNEFPYMPPGCDIQEDLGPYLPARGDFQLRWRYYNNFDVTDWYVQIDSVHIGSSCKAAAGGLVAGRVLDANTHRVLTGATVSDESGRTTRTAVTGGETGFFLFEPAGDHTLTATRNNYQDGVQSVHIGAGAHRVKTVRFQLKAGALLTRPTTLTLNAPVGAATNVTLHIGNRGSAPADWRLASLDAPPSRPNQSVGAPLRVAHCNGRLSPTARGGSAHCAGGSVADVPAANDTGWSAIAPFPVALQDQCAVRDEKTGLVYVMGGLNSVQNAAAVLYAYDPNADTYVHLHNPPTGMQRPVCAFMDGSLYVANGWTQSVTNSPALYVYDPATDSWSRGADNPVPTGGAAASAVLDDRLYVIGGCTNNACSGTTTVEVYDPTNDAWSPAAAYPHPVAWHACATLAGVEAAARIYCAGGATNFVSYSDGYAYDPDADAWEPIADLPVNAEGCHDLWGMAYAGADGQLLVQDGVTCDGNNITNEGFAYDPRRDTWSALPNALDTVYRVADACGFYQFGGDGGLGAPTPAAEVLPGYGLCGTARVPWLAFGTAAGTLAPRTATTSILTIDGTGRTPGTQSVVQVRLSGNTPYGTLTIPLTVNWVSAQ